MTLETTPARHRSVPGTYNLRDVGGYPAEGGATRWGALYRSDGLHRLGETSREAFGALGVRVVVDLRDDGERLASPSRLEPFRVEVRHVPIFPDAAPGAISGPGFTLAELYRRMIAERGERLAAAVREIATHLHAPVLVHCTAGKDRTGVVVALALLAVGVPRAHVLADYAATEVHLGDEWRAGMRARLEQLGATWTDDLAALVTTSPPEALAAALDELEATHGSAAAYFRAHGVTDAELDALRTGLVDPDGATLTPHDPERNLA